MASRAIAKFEKKNKKVKKAKNAQEYALTKNKPTKKKKKKKTAAAHGYSEYAYQTGRRKPDAEDAVPDYVKYNPTRVYADAAQGNLESAYMGQKRKKKKAPRPDTGANMPALRGNPNRRAAPPQPPSRRLQPTVASAPASSRRRGAPPQPAPRAARRRMSAAGEALFATALYANTADLEAGELRFKKNAKIKVVSKSTGQDGWWEGEDVATGKRGLFPANYVSKPKSTAEKKVTATALYDCRPDGRGEISFSEGEKVTILAKNAPSHGDGWWLGVNAAGQKGAFPSNYVKPDADCCIM